MSEKKKVLCVFISNFETHTRYWVADEEKKSVLGALNVVLLVVLLEGGIAILISLKGVTWKKKFGKPWSKTQEVFRKMFKFVNIIKFLTTVFM